MSSTHGNLTLKKQLRPEFSEQTPEPRRRTQTSQNVLDRAKRLLKTKNSPLLQQVEYERCRRDPVYWINNYVYTYNPRRDPLTKQIKGTIPFNLYPFQEEFIRSLHKSILNREDVVIDKSRDMGITWCISVYFVHQWLFTPESAFIVASRVEDLADKKGDLNSIMEKMRFVIQKLPKWMQPPGWDGKSNNSRLFLRNPQNQSTIRGGACTSDFGRAGRATAALLDEMAYWEGKDARAWDGLGDVTDSRIGLSTPNGMANRFGKLANGKLEVLITHYRFLWNLHPEKDRAWYEWKKSRETAQAFAREVELSYSESIEGRVYHGFQVDYHAPSTERRLDPAGRTLVALDYGGTAAALIAQVDSRLRLHVFKEIVLYQEGTDALAVAVIQYLKENDIDPWRIELTADPAGMRDPYQDKGYLNDWELTVKAGLPHPQVSRITIHRDRERVGNIAVNNAFSLRIQGKEMITIDPFGCPELLAAAQGEYRYALKQDGTPTQTVADQHPYNDVADCLRYLVMQFLMITVNDVRKDENRDMGGIQFGV